MFRGEINRGEINPEKKKIEEWEEWNKLFRQERIDKIRKGVSPESKKNNEVGKIFEIEAEIFEKFFKK
ncbi:MAG: hypothetical protein ACK413_01435 [Patescibacteria group bacterium]